MRAVFGNPPAGSPFRIPQLRRTHAQTRISSECPWLTAGRTGRQREAHSSCLLRENHELLDRRSIHDPRGPAREYSTDCRAINRRYLRRRYGSTEYRGRLACREVRTCEIVEYMRQPPVESHLPNNDGLRSQVALAGAKSEASRRPRSFRRRRVREASVTVCVDVQSTQVSSRYISIGQSPPRT